MSRKTQRPGDRVNEKSDPWLGLRDNYRREQTVGGEISAPPPRKGRRGTDGKFVSDPEIKSTSSHPQGHANFTIPVARAIRPAAFFEREQLRAMLTPGEVAMIDSMTKRSERPNHPERLQTIRSLEEANATLAHHRLIFSLPGDTLGVGTMRVNHDLMPEHVVEVYAKAGDRFQDPRALTMLTLPLGDPNGMHSRVEQAGPRCDYYVYPVTVPNAAAVQPLPGNAPSLEGQGPIAWLSNIDLDYEHQVPARKADLPGDPDEVLCLFQLRGGAAVMPLAPHPQWPSVPKLDGEMMSAVAMVWRLVRAKALQICRDERRPTRLVPARPRDLTRTTADIWVQDRNDAIYALAATANPHARSLSCSFGEGYAVFAPVRVDRQQQAQAFPPKIDLVNYPAQDDDDRRDQTDAFVASLNRQFPLGLRANGALLLDFLPPPGERDDAFPSVAELRLGFMHNGGPEDPTLVFPGKVRRNYERIMADCGLDFKPDGVVINKEDTSFTSDTTEFGYTPAEIANVAVKGKATLVTLNGYDRLQPRHPYDSDETAAWTQDTEDELMSLLNAPQAAPPPWPPRRRPVANQLLIQYVSSIPRYASSFRYGGPARQHRGDPLTRDMRDAEMQLDPSPLPSSVTKERLDALVDPLDPANAAAYALGVQGEASREGFEGAHHSDEVLVCLDVVYDTPAEMKTNQPGAQPNTFLTALYVMGARFEFRRERLSNLRKFWQQSLPNRSLLHVWRVARVTDRNKHVPVPVHPNGVAGALPLMEVNVSLEDFPSWAIWPVMLGRAPRYSRQFAGRAFRALAMNGSHTLTSTQNKAALDRLRVVVHGAMTAGNLSMPPPSDQQLLAFVQALLLTMTSGGGLVTNLVAPPAAAGHEQRRLWVQTHVVLGLLDALAGNASAASTIQRAITAALATSRLKEAARQEQQRRRRRQIFATSVKVKVRASKEGARKRRAARRADMLASYDALIKSFRQRHPQGGMGGSVEVNDNEVLTLLEGLLDSSNGKLSLTTSAEARSGDIWRDASNEMKVSLNELKKSADEDVFNAQQMAFHVGRAFGEKTREDDMLRPSVFEAITTAKDAVQTAAGDASNLALATTELKRVLADQATYMIRAICGKRDGDALDRYEETLEVSQDWKAKLATTDEADKDALLLTSDNLLTLCLKAIVQCRNHVVHTFGLTSVDIETEVADRGNVLLGVLKALESSAPWLMEGGEDARKREFEGLALNMQVPALSDALKMYVDARAQTWKHVETIENVLRVVSSPGRSPESLSQDADELRDIATEMKGVFGTLSDVAAKAHMCTTKKYGQNALVITEELRDAINSKLSATNPKFEALQSSFYAILDLFRKGPLLPQGVNLASAAGAPDDNIMNALGVLMSPTGLLFLQKAAAASGQDVGASLSLVDEEEQEDQLDDDGPSVMLMRSIASSMGWTADDDEVVDRLLGELSESGVELTANTAADVLHRARGELNDRNARDLMETLSSIPGVGDTADTDDAFPFGKGSEPKSASLPETPWLATFESLNRSRATLTELEATVRHFLAQVATDSYQIPNDRWAMGPADESLVSRARRNDHERMESEAFELLRDASNKVAELYPDQQGLQYATLVRGAFIGIVSHWPVPSSAYEGLALSAACISRRMKILVCQNGASDVDRLMEVFHKRLAAAKAASDEPDFDKLLSLVDVPLESPAAPRSVALREAAEAALLAGSKAIDQVLLVFKAVAEFMAFKQAHAKLKSASDSMDAQRLTINTKNRDMFELVMQEAFGAKRSDVFDSPGITSSALLISRVAPPFLSVLLWFAKLVRHPPDSEFLGSDYVTWAKKWATRVSKFKSDAEWFAAVKNDTTAPSCFANESLQAQHVRIHEIGKRYGELDVEEMQNALCRFSLFSAEGYHSGASDITTPLLSGTRMYLLQLVHAIDATTSFAKAVEAIVRRAKIIATKRLDMSKIASKAKDSLYRAIQTLAVKLFCEVESTELNSASTAWPSEMVDKSKSSVEVRECFFNRDAVLTGSLIRERANKPDAVNRQKKEFEEAELTAVATYTAANKITAVIDADTTKRVQKYVAGDVVASLKVGDSTVYTPETNYTLMEEMAWLVLSGVLQDTPPVGDDGSSIPSWSEVDNELRKTAFACFLNIAALADNLSKSRPDLDIEGSTFETTEVSILNRAKDYARVTSGSTRKIEEERSTFDDSPVSLGAIKQVESEYVMEDAQRNLMIAAAEARQKLEDEQKRRAAAERAAEEAANFLKIEARRKKAAKMAEVAAAGDLLGQVAEKLSSIRKLYNDDRTTMLATEFTPELVEVNNVLKYIAGKMKEVDSQWSAATFEEFVFKNGLGTELLVSGKDEGSTIANLTAALSLLSQIEAAKLKELAALWGEIRRLFEEAVKEHQNQTIKIRSAKASDVEVAAKGILTDVLADSILSAFKDPWKTVVNEFNSSIGAEQLMQSVKNAFGGKKELNSTESESRNALLLLLGMTEGNSDDDVPHPQLVDMIPVVAAAISAAGEQEIARLESAVMEARNQKMLEQEIAAQNKRRAESMKGLIARNNEVLRNVQELATTLKGSDATSSIPRKIELLSRSRATDLDPKELENILQTVAEIDFDVVKNVLGIQSIDFPLVVEDDPALERLQNQVNANAARIENVKERLSEVLAEEKRNVDAAKKAMLAFMEVYKKLLDTRQGAPKGTFSSDENKGALAIDILDKRFLQRFRSTVSSELVSQKGITEFDALPDTNSALVNHLLQKYFYGPDVTENDAPLTGDMAEPMKAALTAMQALVETTIAQVAAAVLKEANRNLLRELEAEVGKLLEHVEEMKGIVDDSSRTKEEKQAISKALEDLKKKNPVAWIAKVRDLKADIHPDGAADKEVRLANITNVEFADEHFLSVKNADNDGVSRITEDSPKETIEERKKRVTLLNEFYRQYLPALREVVSKAVSDAARPKIEEVITNLDKVMRGHVRNFQKTATSMRQNDATRASYNAWVEFLFDNEMLEGLDDKTPVDGKLIRKLEKNLGPTEKQDYWRNNGLKLDREMVMIDTFANMEKSTVKPNRSTVDGGNYPTIGYSIGPTMDPIVEASKAYVDNPTPEKKPGIETLETQYKKLYEREFVGGTNTDYVGGNENMVLRPLSMYLLQKITSFDADALDVLKDTERYPKSNALKDTVARDDWLRTSSGKNTLGKPLYYQIKPPQPSQTTYTTFEEEINNLLDSVDHPAVANNVGNVLAARIQYVKVLLAGVQGTGLSLRNQKVKEPTAGDSPNLVADPQPSKAVLKKTGNTRAGGRATTGAPAGSYDDDDDDWGDWEGAPDVAPQAAVSSRGSGAAESGGSSSSMWDDLTSIFGGGSGR